MPRSKQAEWLALLRLVPVVTRASVTAPREVKNLFHVLVAGYVRVGWLATPASRPCLICLEPAQVWHHPSYRRGHHATVQPLCLPCHNECHQIAWRQLMAETWLDWTFCTPDARPEVREQAHAIWREL